MQTSLLNTKSVHNWTWTFKWTRATTIPPNAHPQITSAVHAFIQHVSIKHQPSTMTVLGTQELMAKNTKSLLLVGGDKQLNNTTRSFPIMQTLWRKQNVGVTGGGEGSFLQWARPTSGQALLMLGPEPQARNTSLNLQGEDHTQTQRKRDGSHGEGGAPW